jgi:hypothetical protein
VSSSVKVGDRVRIVRCLFGADHTGKVGEVTYVSDQVIAGTITPNGAVNVCLDGDDRTWGSTRFVSGEWEPE